MVTRRVVVGAHYGLQSWLMQRISAAVMAVYTAVFIVALIAAKPSDHASWKALFSHGWLRIATFLFFVSMLLHAWVGMRDIIMDYIKPAGWRLALEVLVILVLVSCGGWALDILWRT
jgi:succinate dehydrogenase / fumarate reductase membrane anchor subunit